MILEFRHRRIQIYSAHCRNSVMERRQDKNPHTHGAAVPTPPPWTVPLMVGQAGAQQLQMLDWVCISDLDMLMAAVSKNIVHPFVCRKRFMLK